MRSIIQRVKKASVIVDGETIGQIDHGLFLLLGYEEEDNLDDIEWMVKKVLGMRIFADEDGKMNRSIQEVNGGLLLVSQFTLHASTKKGNRPSFVKASKPNLAERQYESTVAVFKENYSGKIETGRFAAYMIIDAVNDGPVTIVMDSKRKE